MVAVARDHAPLAELAAAGAGIRVEAADAAREEAASELISRYRPEILVLVAGAIPVGDVGKAGVRAYAARTGKTEDQYLADMGEPLTPELAGSALVDLVLADPQHRRA